MAEKKGVIILYKYQDLLAKLSLEDQGRILQASLKFDMTGELTELENPVADMLFSVMVKDFIAMKENWEDTVDARSEAGKKGAEARWGKAQSNTDTAKPAPSETRDSKNGNAIPGNGKNSKGISEMATDSKNANNDNVNVKKEGADAPDFSFSQNLNPNQSKIEDRLAEITPEWNNLNLGPPFTLTLANLRDYERADLLTGLDRYPNPVIIKAMRNYKEISDSPDYDPGGCCKYSFFSFLVKGVDRYRDEAKPFEKFRKRGREPPSSSSHKPPTAAEDDQYDTAIRAMMGG